MPDVPAATPPPVPPPVRTFGRFALHRLLGKSDATMIWLAIDGTTGAETMLAMPRVPPTGAAGLERWMQAAQRAARLDHPNLAAVIECATQENWPYAVVDRGGTVTLEEWLAARPKPAVADSTLWIAAALRGLAYAHDAGVAHLDMQLGNILIDERGEIKVMALAIGQVTAPPEPKRSLASTGTVRKPAAAAPPTLRDHRTAAERDVLACGVLLNRLLAGEPPLEIADTSRVMDQMAPEGREFVRLPWTTPQPVPEALRAIVNRSTAGQLRLRYRSARTFLGALTGWREDATASEDGPIAMLLERLETVGHLPAMPGLELRVRKVTAIETQRTEEIVRQLLPDMALSFELLRILNSAHVQSTQVSGNGPVLTLRRVVALIGINGVRAAANSLRLWPGPLQEEGSKALKELIERTHHAAHLAQALRPAGYDAEVMYLITVLQNLGRLLVRYHFVDEAEQIAQLMQPEIPKAVPGEQAPPEQPGFSEEAAAYAVFGVDIEAFGSVVAKLWGFGEDVLFLIRRLPVGSPVHRPDGDADTLRMIASAANELVDAVNVQPQKKVNGALAAVSQRYGRILGLTSKELLQMVNEAKVAMNGGAPAAAVVAAAAPAAAEAGAAKKVTSLTPALVATVGAASFPT